MLRGLPSVGFVIKKIHEVAQILDKEPLHVQAKIIGDDVDASCDAKICGQSTPSLSCRNGAVSCSVEKPSSGIVYIIKLGKLSYIYLA